ncbi:hypothetical protein DesyoDRAFT_2721 [Desulfosporosinus youngiae DSM 17734]|uniref:Uncharacterized protein n=1 Tax=Desulfosporosinus youngiae DSM 17734 TaxID=768710 RepID=H5Y4P0_9FIRM|nr:hypothetical protein DesyoDRAFT_2721 [Desulfosporosinus youngiae DSM 17734]
MQPIDQVFQGILKEALTSKALSINKIAMYIKMSH